MSKEYDKEMDFTVSCTKPDGSVVKHTYARLVEVLIERNTSAKTVMALFKCCDDIVAGETVDGGLCNMKGYTFKRI